MSLDLLTPSELAAQLRCSKPTVDRLRQTGAIHAAISEGRIIRYNLAQVTAALTERANKPKPKTRLRLA